MLKLSVIGSHGYLFVWAGIGGPLLSQLWLIVCINFAPHSFSTNLHWSYLEGMVTVVLNSKTYNYALYTFCKLRLLNMLVENEDDNRENASQQNIFYTLFLLVWIVKHRCVEHFIRRNSHDTHLSAKRCYSFSTASPVICSTFCRLFFHNLRSGYVLQYYLRLRSVVVDGRWYSGYLSFLVCSYFVPFVFCILKWSCSCVLQVRQPQHHKRIRDWKLDNVKSLVKEVILVRSSV